MPPRPSTPPEPTVAPRHAFPVQDCVLLLQLECAEQIAESILRRPATPTHEGSGEPEDALASQHGRLHELYLVSKADEACRC